jgi:hypothetical protein
LDTVVDIKKRLALELQALVSRNAKPAEMGDWLAENAWHVYNALLLSDRRDVGSTNEHKG